MSNGNFHIKLGELKWKENMSIFASPDYMSCLSDNYGWLFDENDLFFIPFFIKKYYIFKTITFLSDVESLGETTISKEEKALFLNSVVQFCKLNLKIDIINQSPAFTLFDSVPDGAIFAPFGSYRIDLRLSIDDLWKNIHSKHKNVIRKAIKNNVVVKSGREYLQMAVSLVSETLERSNLSPLEVKSMEILADKLGGHLLPYVCFHNDIIQGAAIYIYSQKSAFYEWGGSKKLPSTGAVNYLHWVAIQGFKNKGVNFYDLVGGRVKPKQGSKLEGIQRFKSRFGSIFHRGFLWKFPLTFKGYLFQILIRIYFAAKGKSSKDIVDQERIN